MKTDEQPNDSEIFIINFAHASLLLYIINSIAFSLAINPMASNSHRKHNKSFFEANPSHAICNFIVFICVL